MSPSKDERNRILALIEAGQINAAEAAQLLDALDREPEQRSGSSRGRTLRIRTTSPHAKNAKTHVSATIPVQLLRSGLRVGAYLVPQLSQSTWDDLLLEIERGTTGRLLDVQDLEQGQRLEIFIE